MNRIIEIIQLTKSYGKHRGVEEISLSVNEGDFFALLGPNGAGKSTLIRSMMGLSRCEKGLIRIFGKDAAGNRKAILKDIGYMSSEPMFYPSMKVNQVLQMAADMRNKNCRKHAKELSERLQLNTEKEIRELSLEERKKVGMICALQHQPRLLLLDEPTAGVSSFMQETFFELLKEVNGWGTTCFFSTQALSDVRNYGKNAAVIHNGRIIQRNSAEKLAQTKLRLVQVWKNGEEKSFPYDGPMHELVALLAELKVDDVLIEEPPLENVIMQYYEEQETK